MNILIVDNNESAAQAMKVKFEKLAYHVTCEPKKDNALQLMTDAPYDLVILDPAPIPEPAPVLLNMRRAHGKYAYILLASAKYSQTDSIRAGANDHIEKPVDPDHLMTYVENAKRLSKLVNRIGDHSEDFPSAGGVIAKSAFNQLFTSALDRATRYGEKTYVLFVSLTNYDKILKDTGSYGAKLMVANFSKALVSIRRQSDIVGQTAPSEYAILLQRPSKVNEPKNAARRFAETLARMLECDDKISEAGQMQVQLIELPTGRQVARHEWTMCTEDHNAAIAAS